MSNNYRFVSPSRRRGSQLSLFTPPSNHVKKEVPNIDKKKTDIVLCSITKMPVIDSNANLHRYREYLSKLKTYNVKILELTQHYLENPIDRSNIELCETFYQYSVKCITQLEKLYPKETIMMEENSLYENSSDENYMFDPFTIIEKTSGLHLSAFVSKKI